MQREAQNTDNTRKRERDMNLCSILDNFQRITVVCCVFGLQMRDSLIILLTSKPSNRTIRHAVGVR